MEGDKDVGSRAAGQCLEQRLSWPDVEPEQRAEHEQDGAAEEEQRGKAQIPVNWSRHGARRHSHSGKKKDLA